MRRFLAVIICVSLTGILVGFHTPAQAAPAVVWPQIGLKQVADGLDDPTNITNAADGSGRIFITEQVGRVRIIKAGALLSTAFLDITDRVDPVYRIGGRGLIGLAFPPGFAAKQHFYVDYTNSQNDIVIARFNVSANPDVADAQSGAIVLTILHPDSSEHYGGQLAFGPNDGYLYIGVGDGGPQQDPQNNAQRTDVLLGKLLRIDVESGAATYSIPPTNPFANDGTVLHEIWATGLRNPWRYSFDRGSGDLYLGDVGYNTYEEVDVQPAAAAGGQNYGWRIMEGLHCTPFDTCVTTGLTLPVFEYDHSNGNAAITGGYVYRGPHNQLLRGKYFYGDFISGHLAALVYDGSAWQQGWLSDASFAISTFGEDEAGNLYVANYAAYPQGAVDIISSRDVDGWLEAATPVGGPPGGIASTVLRLGNYGLQTAASVSVTATLPAGLTFASSSPSPASQIANTLSWSLPDMAFQSSAQITLLVNVQAAAYGTRYPIGWQLASSGPEANPGDNLLTTEVMVSHQIYLPFTMR